MINSEQRLFTYISADGPWDAIVVEGYDGVGKGKVLSSLSEFMGVEPYRPDYNLWQNYDHRQIDRWKISGFFWDVFSHFHQSSGSNAMLFDRGVISGAVYNHDDSIALNYKKLLRDMRVLHVLVTCSEEDYYQFADVRKSISPMHYEVCKGFTEEYKRLLDLAEVEYVIYENHYDKSFAGRMFDTCGGCGHYSYGVCRHPLINRVVSPESIRCTYSADKEVQDENVDEMHCV